MRTMSIGGNCMEQKEEAVCEADGLISESEMGEAPVLIVEPLHSCLRAVGSVYELKKKKKKIKKKATSQYPRVAHCTRKLLFPVLKGCTLYEENVIPST
jgi:hypothetical protein